MADSFSNISCSVEVYPFEGGPFTIQGGQIQSVTVSKTIRGDGAGSFDIQFAPGGPYGPESTVTWAQVLTPMSHVLIGMGRGSDRAIVMDGIVVSAGETQQWRTSSRGSFAARAQAVSGGDFSWFFRTFNYYALTFYGLTAGTPLGAALEFLPGLFEQFSSQGLVGGASIQQSNPVQVGRTWFRNIMSGKNGILGHTYVPYKTNSRKAFSEIVAANWESYPKVFIPLSDNFMTHEESWMGKFKSIFPHPWYEFFVTTATKYDYVVANASSYSGSGNIGGKNIADPGYQFSMTSMPGVVPAGPLLVARVNPCPVFEVLPVLSNGTVVAGSMDVSRWTALPLTDFSQSSFGYLRSDISFSAEDARNFYQLNPTGFSTILQGNNASNTTAPLLFKCVCDAASVQRYGFRPEIGTVRWLFDPQGTTAQNPSTGILDTVVFLTGSLVSWHHPTPLMAHATVVIPLAPNIKVGTRFRYRPWKGDNAVWEFYIESVTHTFEFEGNSTTKLELTRGLPLSVYQDTADSGKLRAVHTGNAQRKNGVYEVGLPAGSAPSLQFVNTNEQVATLNQQLATVFVTPQAGTN